MKHTTGYPLACEYLGRVQHAERHVEWLQQKAGNLRMLLTDTAVHLSDIRCSNTPDPQKDQEIQAEIDELEREIAEAEKARVDIRIEVRRMLTHIKDLHGQRALILYYLENKRWTEVADKMKFSIAQTFRFRDVGLAELEALLEAAA